MEWLASLNREYQAASHGLAELCDYLLSLRVSAMPKAQAEVGKHGLGIHALN